MVRLYGASLENCDYPYPGQHFSKTARKSVPDPDLADVSIHNLIRKDDRPDADKIRAFDAKFKRYMEILDAKERRRKERENANMRHMKDGREIPANLLSHLKSFFISHTGANDEDDDESTDSTKSIFEQLAIRYASLVYDAEDTTQISSKAFRAFAKENLENLIREMWKDQNDDEGGSILREIKAFKSLVNDAIQRELQKYEVIFCTTAVATSARFLRAVRGRVFQLIIDECGMCTEPDSLAAIIATGAEQVVLIGDHKQLRPIVVCTHAEELGLERSMFERYQDMSMMLCMQYRMVRLYCHLC